LGDEMLDSNWETLNGEVAHEIEALNYANQVHVIEALIKIIVAKGGLSPSGSSNQGPNINALKELHRTATLFLLNSPGEFRQIEVFVEGVGGTVRHQPPPWQEVDAHVQNFFTELSIAWATNTPIYIAALCLWKINWIHPFMNGNGRTARAFSYACLCLKYGFTLPGRVTVIDLIMSNPQHRTAYEAALNLADTAFAQNKYVDVSALEALLRVLLVEQLSSILPAPTSGNGSPGAN
jgi:fido (protein-threonine AMPylation protein)